MKLVPLKVKIGLRANGYADHPNWNLLPSIDKTMHEKLYMPYGWIYDKDCGHAEARKDIKWESPVGMQWGCLLVTQEFADEAVATFPTLISIITEAEFEDFYNNKAMAHLSEYAYDNEELSGLKLEHDLKLINDEDVTDIKQRIAKAVDPKDSAKGIVKSKDKLWADKKVLIDVTIKSVEK